MAVPGRKQACPVESIDAGSVEGFVQKCEPCLTIGLQITAHGYCVQCQEYLCKTCHDCHKRTKALQKHQLLGRDEFDNVETTRKSLNECKEECPLHDKEVIKFYCQTHALLGCHDCMTIGHRACKIDYIPEKCEGIADGRAYSGVMTKLDEKLKEVEEVSNTAEMIIRDVNENNKDIIQKITDYRAEINDRLDQLQEDSLNNAERMKANKMGILQDVIDTCERMTTNLKSWRTALCTDKSTNQSGQLYIDIKRAELTLKSDEVNEAKEKMLTTKEQYTFRRSEDFENLLSKGTVFVELSSYLHSEATKKNTIDHLTKRDEVNIKTKSDKKECSISGCAVLPPNKLVLADCNNKKVKVVSVESNLVQQEKVLDSRPFDVAAISPDMFAVTMLDKGKSDVMKTALTVLDKGKLGVMTAAVTMLDKGKIDVMKISDGRISRVRSIKVDGSSFGIGFHQDLLYAACLGPFCIVTMTTQGTVIGKFSLPFLSSLAVPYIALGKDADFLYISDTDNNSVVSVSSNGSVLDTYKHKVLHGPMGMCLLDDKSSLVCCRNGSIHQIEDKCKGGRVIYEGILHPKSMCNNARSGEVYVGCNGNLLKVFSTK